MVGVRKLREEERRRSIAEAVVVVIEQVVVVVRAIVRISNEKTQSRHSSSMPLTERGSWHDPYESPHRETR